MSTPPSALERTVATWNPQRATDAGFVPWAVSGMRIVERLWPFLSKCFLMIMTPVSSPCAPAAGWRENSAIPQISARYPASS